MKGAALVFSIKGPESCLQATRFRFLSLMISRGLLDLKALGRKVFNKNSIRVYLHLKIYIHRYITN